MNEETKRKVAWLLVAAVLTAISIFLGVSYPVPAAPGGLGPEPVELGTTHFTAIEAEDLTATDDLVVTDDSTFGDAVTISGAFTASGAQTAEGKLTVNDQVLIDEDSDEVALTVQAYTTPTVNLVEYQTAGGFDLFTVSATGDVLISGTTPLLTIGDAGAENTAILFDGAAQDFHIGLYDTADDLVIGKGSALGTTTAIGIDENLLTTFSGAVTVGASATTGTDVTFYSATSGDHFLWDASEEALTIIGTNGQDALNIDDGNVDIADNVDVDGTGDFADTLTCSKGSGTAFSVSSGGELNVDGTLDVNGTSDFGAAVTCSFAGNCLTSGATADIEWLGFAAFGNGTPNGVTDGTAEAVYVEGGLEVDSTFYADGAIDADGDLDVDGTTNLDDVDIDLTASLNIDGHMVDIGTGSCSVAAGDNDLCVAGVVEIDGELELDGALDADSTANIAGALTLQSLLYPSFGNETITNGELLTPTVTVYALDSGGAVTFTLSVAGAVEGQLLILIGDDANNVIVDYVNVRTSTGAKLTLGQYDVVMFVLQDAEWIELFTLANS